MPFKIVEALTQQKIPQQIVAMLGQNGFWVELHTFDSQGFMAYPHDFLDIAKPVLGPGGDFQTLGQAVLVDHQGMVAGGGERVA